MPLHSLGPIPSLVTHLQLAAITRQLLFFSHTSGQVWVAVWREPS